MLTLGFSFLGWALLFLHLVWTRLPFFHLQGSFDSSGFLLEFLWFLTTLLLYFSSILYFNQSTYFFLSCVGFYGKIFLIGCLLCFVFVTIFTFIDHCAIHMIWLIWSTITCSHSVTHIVLFVLIWFGLWFAAICCGQATLLYDFWWFLWFRLFVVFHNPTLYSCIYSILYVYFDLFSAFGCWPGYFLSQSWVVSMVKLIVVSGHLFYYVMLLLVFYYTGVWIGNMEINSQTIATYPTILLLIKNP